jgi:cell wall-associated NlpC family hydrolase
LDSARAAVLAAAEAWIGTPFHDLARVKGAGVDCAQLVAAVYHEAGIFGEIVSPAYSPQFMLHRDEERLADFVLRYAREIRADEARPADVVLYKIGRCFAHAAIIVEWPREIIHAHKLSGKVVRMHPFTADLQDRPTRFFSAWAA